jgi:hypothetical protein
MKAALVAFILLVLFSGLGVYIINGGKSGIVDFFDVFSRQATASCEKAYNICLEKGETIKNCTTAYNECIGDIVNSSVYKGETQPSNSKSSGTSAASAGTLGKNKLTTTDDIGTTTLVVPMTVDGEEFEVSYNDLVAAANSGFTKSSELEKLLKEIQSRKDKTYEEDPTQAQLDLAQGDSTPIPAYSSYFPHQKTIRSHQTPHTETIAVSANAPTDRGTVAEKIAIDDKKIASLRQNIRDEVANVVRDELNGSAFFNQYQINYSAS